MATKPKNSWLEPPNWWKRWKPLRIIALGVIGFSVYSTTWTIHKYVLPPESHPQTEFYTAVEDRRVSLAAFQSYDSLATVQAALTAGGFTWTADHMHAPHSDLYPLHEMDTVSVPAYRHLDNDGALVLEFFNNRLYEADFIPKDPDAYARTIHVALPELKRNRVGDAIWISGPLRVVSNVDLVRSDVGQSLRAHPYVIWQDLRLIVQRDQWDRDFGEMPIKGP